MDDAMNVGLKEEIIAELTIELARQPTFNADILANTAKGEGDFAVLAAKA